MTRLIGNRVEQCLNIADLRRAAARRAHRMVFDYIDGGSDDEWTLDNNVRAFDRYELPYRVLTGPEDIDLTTTVLGTQIDVPFFCSPVIRARRIRRCQRIAIVHPSASQ